MTFKAIDILQTRSKKNSDEGWIMKSEGAGIAFLLLIVCQMMHALDYDRALAS
jgi:hypothetical protein